MTDVDVTPLFRAGAWHPSRFSASQAEQGPSAGPDTWRRAMEQAAAEPLMAARHAELEPFRNYMRGFGAWTDTEIDAWTPQHCNALLIQCVAADMREAGFTPGGRRDWRRYRADSQAGRISGNLYPRRGRVFFTLDT